VPRLLLGRADGVQLRIEDAELDGLQVAEAVVHAPRVVLPWALGDPTPGPATVELRIEEGAVADRLAELTPLGIRPRVSLDHGVVRLGVPATRAELVVGLAVRDDGTLVLQPGAGPTGWWERLGLAREIPLPPDVRVADVTIDRQAVTATLELDELPGGDGEGCEEPIAGPPAPTAGAVDHPSAPRADGAGAHVSGDLAACSVPAGRPRWHRSTTASGRWGTSCAANRRPAAGSCRPGAGVRRLPAADRRRPRAHRRAGPLPDAGARHRARVLRRPRRPAAPAQPRQHLPRVPGRPRPPGPVDGGPDPVGRPGRAAAQPLPDRRARRPRLAPRPGVGGDHRGGDRRARRPRPAAGRRPVGARRPRARAAPRRRPPDRVAAPEPDVGGPRVLRFAAVQPHERAPRGAGCAAVDWRLP
jgi:hypothetical protein